MAFRWLYHRVIRHRQRAALATDLDVTFRSVFGRPVPAIDLRRLLEAFDALIDREHAAARHAAAWPDRAALADSLRRISAWTWAFHPRLLALAESIRLWSRGEAPVVDMVAYRDRPAAVAWFAVIELALRAQCAASAGASAAAPGAADFAVVEGEPTPTVAIPADPGGPVRGIGGGMAFDVVVFGSGIGTGVRPPPMLPARRTVRIELSGAVARDRPTEADRCLLDAALDRTPRFLDQPPFESGGTVPVSLV